MYHHRYCCSRRLQEQGQEEVWKFEDLQQEIAKMLRTRKSCNRFGCCWCFEMCDKESGKWLDTLETAKRTEVLRKRQDRSVRQEYL